MRSKILALIAIIVVCSDLFAESEVETKPSASGYFGVDRYEEQISCHKEDCIQYTLDDLNEKGGKSELKRLLSENVGKVFIDTVSKRLKLGDDGLEDIRDFLLEISKRDGRVAVEKLHIATRGLEIPQPPLLKDVGFVGWNVFKRVYRGIYYRPTTNYNAKVLYNPTTGNIAMVFIVHKRYGDICETVFASCNEIEYLDEDTFDLQLSTAIKESKEKGLPVRVNFRQVEATLPETRLEWDNLKNMGRSARMYKWLAAAKDRDVKPVVKSRFLPLQAALTVIDYSLSVYDWIGKYVMYKPATDTNAEVLYTEKINPEGKVSRSLHSVVFAPIPKSSE
ncbi:hypothetical protein LEP1GSC047_4092 [Leptospira inadai serovar Lyme str. 10]|uniref:Uncharacterized protein n=1 Tax=Leptospira inadai serovar Lyme str. 10 TaxID=1049790 RepID=V6HDS2_9LEPT|nr:hypothetical protein [Leptospira inadai]EQA37308.1 hypothetical protein LEP1GSC047_4092 [Leptospira inadai serovar Lyme str. 10]